MCGLCDCNPDGLCVLLALEGQLPQHNYQEQTDNDERARRYQFALGNRFGGVVPPASKDGATLLSAICL